MKLSDIKKLITGAMDFSTFKELISEEVSTYHQLLHKRGSSIPIQLSEDESLLIGKDEFRFLCIAYIHRNLSYIELAYVADAILLSSHVQFQNDQIQEGVEYFCDLDTNEAISVKDVEVIMKQIAG